MASRPSNIKISDLPVEVVLQLMKDYGKTKSRTLRTSRTYLRSIGMNISSTGKILYPDDIEVVRDIVPSVREIIGPVKLAKAFKSKKRILATKAFRASSGTASKRVGLSRRIK
ncbi:MAG TPA: hypothetical protein PK430_07960 [Muribaculum sp.]|jgi:hypothetical protein|uniref:Uncharacterized protein n=1 Tax=Heminiphilus faecis TaxID=2601703 RepID=A0ABV4CZI6_9BACT|nr:hypothetical protein [Heminiphilus faecis]HRF69146.1 hypothetical protein [Muribaculum sp.]